MPPPPPPYPQAPATGGQPVPEQAGFGQPSPPQHASVPAQGGYPVQPGAVWGQPYPVVYAYAPPFAVGGGKPPRDPRLKDADRTVNRMCLLVLAQSGAALVWEFLLMIVMGVLRVDLYSDPMAYHWLSAALVPLSTALPFFVYLLVTGADVSRYLKFEKVGFFGGVLCVAGGLGVCLAANLPAFVIQGFFGQFGYEPMKELFPQKDSWAMLFLELFSTAVVVPVMEEFAFRGVLLSSLRKYGLGFAIVTSALVFSLVHMDFSNVVFAFVAGLVFGFIYARTNNLWLTVMIHALNNGLAVLSSYSAFLFGETMAEVAENALIFVPMALGVLALILLLAFKRDVFITYLSPRYDGPSRPLKAGEGASCIVRSPAFWVIVAMMLSYTVSLFFS